MRAVNTGRKVVAQGVRSVAVGAQHVAQGAGNVTATALESITERVDPEQTKGESELCPAGYNGSQWAQSVMRAHGQRSRIAGISVQHKGSQSRIPRPHNKKPLEVTEVMGDTPSAQKRDTTSRPSQAQSLRDLINGQLWPTLCCL